MTRPNREGMSGELLAPRTEEARTLRCLDIARPRRPVLRRHRPDRSCRCGDAKREGSWIRTLFSKYIENMDNMQEGSPCGDRHTGESGVALDQRPAWPAWRLYQACGAWQCGQTTVVETGARNMKPHWHA
jgi:hypothetical protein